MLDPGQVDRRYAAAAVVALDGIELPDVLGGRYRPVRLVGAGGMGRVLEVVHEHTGEHLALKLLSSLAHDEEAAVRFRREARTFTAVGGEHVVRVLDAGTLPELGDTPYLAMELLDGEDLARRLARDGPQDPADVVRWTHAIAEALDRAHAAGIVHRDLKPGNVFLVKKADGGSDVKVIDFGVAKVADLSSHTAEGALVGTPRWAAPEQIESPKSVGKAADQWSLAMVVFACLVGRSYVEGSTVSQILSQVLFAELSPPSRRGCRAGAAFDAWFLRSCARDPGARWPSAGDQARALEEALRGAARQEAPPTPSDDPTVTEGVPAATGARTAPSDAGRRPFFPLVVAGVVAVALAAVTAWGLRPRNANPSPSAAPPASSAEPAPAASTTPPNPPPPSPTATPSGDAPAASRDALPPRSATQAAPAQAPPTKRPTKAVDPFGAQK